MNFGLCLYAPAKVSGKEGGVFGEDSRRASAQMERAEPLCAQFANCDHQRRSRARWNDPREDARNKDGAPVLSLDDEPRIMAVLATAYEQPIV